MEYKEVELDVVYCCPLCGNDYLETNDVDSLFCDRCCKEFRVIVKEEE